MKDLNKITLAVCALLALGACSSAKEKLCVTRKSPDEFAVVKRAPLAMPPDYSLRPPRPGAPRPQEGSPVDEARSTVLGETAAEPVEGSTKEETLFLQQAGASNA